MGLSQFRGILTVALLLLFFGVLSASNIGQSTPQESAYVTISPTEVTLHKGQTQMFEATVEGTQSTGIRWTIQERNGGRIAEDGTYTAPRHIGLYHVVAASEEKPAAKAVAKVTVVTEYDTPDGQKLK